MPGSWGTCGDYPSLGTPFSIVRDPGPQADRVHKLLESRARVLSMPRSEQEHREEIVRVGRLMFDKGWIAANDGNITVRLDGGRLLATPRGVSKGMLKPEDLVVVDMDG